MTSDDRSSVGASGRGRPRKEPIVAAAQLRVRVQPGATRTGVAGMVDGVLRVRVAAPPATGRANAALLEFLADAMELRPWAVRVVRGLGSREKLVSVERLTTEDALRRLLGAGGATDPGPGSPPGRR